MNKIDLITDQKSVEARAHALALNYGDHYSLTSALEGTGINELFMFSFDLIAKVIKNQQTEDTVPSNNVDIKPTENSSEQQNASNKCGC